MSSKGNGFVPTSAMERKWGNMWSGCLHIHRRTSSYTTITAFVYKWKICVNFALSKSTVAIFPTVYWHFVSRQIQIFVIVRPFKTLLPSRVMILCFGDILCSCGNCFETPHTIFIHKSDFNISMWSNYITNQEFLHLSPSPWTTSLLETTILRLR